MKIATIFFITVFLALMGCKTSEDIVQPAVNTNQKQPPINEEERQQKLQMSYNSGQRDLSSPEMKDLDVLAKNKASLSCKKRKLEEEGSNEANDEGLKYIDEQLAIIDKQEAGFSQDIAMMNFFKMKFEEYLLECK